MLTSMAEVHHLIKEGLLANPEEEVELESTFSGGFEEEVGRRGGYVKLPNVLALES